MADASDAEKYDGVLLNIAQQSGSIDNILDIFFGFLLRKTDFYTGGQDDSAAEAMVMKYYKKHAKTGQKKRQEQAEKNRIADEERKKRADAQKKKDEAEFQRQQAEKSEAVEISDEEALKIMAEKAARASGAQPAAEKADGKKADDDKADGEEGEKEEKEEEDKEPPPEGNGGKTERYTWTQTLSALEIYVPVRPGVKAKQIVCDIGAESLKVGVKGDELILNGKMHSKVKTDDCMWTLLDNKTVQISIEKFDAMKWWNCVMVGDAEIDTKKIVPENSKLSDLDGETRQTVEKMMYDQRQKALGKPTSEQEKTHDLLEKFKASHPEMDFSQAKVNYGGGGGNFNFGG